MGIKTIREDTLLIMPQSGCIAEYYLCSISTVYKYKQSLKN